MPFKKMGLLKHGPWPKHDSPEVMRQIVIRRPQVWISPFLGPERRLLLYFYKFNPNLDWVRMLHNPYFHAQWYTIYRDLTTVYTNENWFVILLSHVYFGDWVTKIRHFSPLKTNNSAQLRTQGKVQIVTYKNFQ